MFDDLTLIRTAQVPLARGTMKVKTYGERASRSGDEKIPAEVTVCKGIARVLYSAYPGHPWHVEVMAEQGVAKITIPPLLGMNWGYILHLDQECGPRQIIEAGGHILERFRIPRSSIDIGAYVAAEEKIPLIGNFRARHRDRIPS